VSEDNIIRKAKKRPPPEPLKTSELKLAPPPEPTRRTVPQKTKA